MEYQYYKNKKIKIKNEKKENVKNKKIKNFLINNEKNSCKFYKIINNISQSHRITNKSVNHKMYYQKGKLYNINGYNCIPFSSLFAKDHQLCNRADGLLLPERQ